MGFDNTQNLILTPMNLALWIISTIPSAKGYIDPSHAGNTDNKLVLFFYSSLTINVTFCWSYEVIQNGQQDCTKSHSTEF